MPQRGRRQAPRDGPQDRRARRVAGAGDATLQRTTTGAAAAVVTQRALPGVDPSTFIVGHPAAPRFVAGHANHEHPAVTAHEAAPELDTDRYLVQPPASARWVTTAAAAPVVVR